MKWLEMLSYNDRRVVDLETSADGKIMTITEACDGYFSAYMDKSQFGLLIEELQEMHKLMN